MTPDRNTGIVSVEMNKVRAGLGYENFNDMYGGQTDFSIFDSTPIAELVKSGKLYALAVTSSTRLVRSQPPAFWRGFLRPQS